MKIKLSLDVAIKLLAYAAATPLEFSGFGFCDRVGEDIFVYDFVLLDVGNEGYTEIDPKKILPLIEREDHGKMKVWIHKHPIDHWSGRDLQTILREPLGSTPELVGWSVSIVLTPKGWIGRIDNYKNDITRPLEIEPQISDLYGAIRELEVAHRPFQSEGRWRQVDFNGNEYDLDEEYEEDYGDNPPDAETIIEALEQLAAEIDDPYSITVAELFDEYGVDWKKINKNKVRM